MVKGFNEKEKQIIRDTLLEKGKELFGTYGLKKTSITDLTKAAGIAQGSFYLFFNSKEELFFEIFELEEERIKSNIIDFFKANRVTKKYFKEALRRGLEMMRTNPIIKRVHMEDEYKILFRKLPPERLERHFEQDTGIIFPLIEQWQKEGLIIRRKPEVIASLMRALYVVTLHRDVIGDEIFEETMDLLTELIAGGLIKEKNNDEI